jgi:DNA-binding MarR family transcriptional regulator
MGHRIPASAGLQECQRWADAILVRSAVKRRAPDPADGRQTLLSLTDACRKWAEEGRAARQDWLTRTLQARLSPQEQDELARGVELLKRLVHD